MPKEADIATFVEELLKQQFVWDDIFAVRDTNHFIICQPPAIQSKIDKVKTMIVENEALKTPNFQQWNVTSKNDRLTIRLTRERSEFAVYLVTPEEKILWLEGIDCKKHALLHIHALMRYLISYFDVRRSASVRLC